MQIKGVPRGKLGQLIKEDLGKLRKRSVLAAQIAANYGIPRVKANVPEAFGDLKKDIRRRKKANGARIVTGQTAPHAAAVEVGSRPHTPPLDALVRWVKLRGMQGLEEGATGHAPRVAAEIAKISGEAERDAGDGEFSPVDAPVQIAKRIQAAIAQRGTKPHHYMLNTLPEIVETLDIYVNKYFAEPL